MCFRRVRRDQWEVMLGSVLPFSQRCHSTATAHKLGLQKLAASAYTRLLLVVVCLGNASVEPHSYMLLDEFPFSFRMATFLSAL